MYIGNYAADSYYSVKSYATAMTNKICNTNCQWYDLPCHAMKFQICNTEKYIAAPADNAAKATTKAAGEAAGNVIKMANEGVTNVGKSLGEGLGGAATQASPTLIMMGIAALGILAIVMVIR